jgi:hypothetical protein
MAGEIPRRTQGELAWLVGKLTWHQPKAVAKAPTKAAGQSRLKKGKTAGAKADQFLDREMGTDPKLTPSKPVSTLRLAPHVLPLKLIGTS